MTENPRIGSSFEKLDFHVEWSQEDGEFVATCRKFPFLSHLAATEFEALRGIRDLVADVLEHWDE